MSGKQQLFYAIFSRTNRMSRYHHNPHTTIAVLSRSDTVQYTSSRKERLGFMAREEFEQEEGKARVENNNL